MTEIDLSAAKIPPRREGTKHDADKVRLDLLPVDALHAIAEVLTIGAATYGDRNWEQGMAWGRLYRAAISHLMKWWAGEPTDRDTGKPHLAHAACCVLFLLAYHLRGAGTDNRPAPSANLPR